MSAFFVPQISVAQTAPRGFDAEAEKPQDKKTETKKSDVKKPDDKKPDDKKSAAKKTDDKKVKAAKENVEAPKPKPKTEKQLRAEALKAREEAELRVEADMQTMTNIVEALSKNLGQIHYLRTLCFGSNDQKWRNYANDMMRVEAPDDPEQRSQFVRAFNAGYYQEKERHTQCSNKVSVDVAALAENSRNLASMLGDPYRQR